MQTKYIIFDNTFAVIFVGAMTHAAFNYRDTSNPQGPEGRFDIKRPTSAGFCTIYEKDGRIDVHAFGESITLGLASKPTDAALIKIALGIS